MIDRGIGDRRAIVELENTECFLGVDARAEVTNALIGDLFASRQSLAKREDRFVAPQTTMSTYQDLNARAMVNQMPQCFVGHLQIDQ